MFVARVEHASGWYCDLRWDNAALTSAPEYVLDILAADLPLLGTVVLALPATAEPGFDTDVQARATLAAWARFVECSIVFDPVAWPVLAPAGADAVY